MCHRVLLLVLVVSGCTNPDFAPGPPTRLVVLQSACQNRTIGVGDAQLFTAFGIREDAEIDCAGVLSCDDYDRCVGVDRGAPCEFPDPPRCEGDTLVLCDPNVGFLQRVDCAASEGAGTCLLGDDGFPRCTTGERCTRAECAGNVLRSCADGLVRERDCGADATCVETADGALCLNRVEPCDASACRGDVLEGCLTEGFVEIDCTRTLGADRCVDQDGTARCEPATVECDDRAVECAEDVGRVCIEGAWIEFDCGAFGATCELVMDDRLRCVLP